MIIAKGWKIGERYDDGPEAFAEVKEDIGDIYRLLQASDPHATASMLRVLRDERHVGASVRTGARYLRDLCTSGGAGLRAFSELLGSSVGERRASASLAALVEEFDETVEAVFGEAPSVRSGSYSRLTGARKRKQR